MLLLRLKNALHIGGHSTPAMSLFKPRYHSKNTILRFHTLSSSHKLPWMNSMKMNHSMFYQMIARRGCANGSSSVTSTNGKKMTQVERLKDLWRKYGIVAVGTYFTMYGVVLGSIYLAIENDWVSIKKTSRNDEANGQDFNLVTTTNKFVKIAEDWGIAKHLDVQRVNSKTGSFLIAWVVTKFTEPVRLALTLAITPRLSRWIRGAPPLKK